jgi:hypothetical protein
MIQTPTCPQCGAWPEFVLEDDHAAFCGTDDCHILSWDTHLTSEALDQGQGVTLKDQGWPTP